MNPPFCLKRQFIQKAYESGKPFLAFVPLACVATVSMASILSLHGCELNILVGQPKFWHNGRWTAIGNMVWIAGIFFCHIFLISFFKNFLIKKEILSTFNLIQQNSKQTMSVEICLTLNQNNLVKSLQIPFNRSMCLIQKKN